MATRREFMKKAIVLSAVAASGLGAASTHEAAAKVAPDTSANLMDAFAGESQATRKYEIYAEQAEKEGFPQVAKLFRANAAAEKIHARNHLKSVGKLGNTMQNLQDAMNGESYEAQKMYPAMVETANMEGKKEIANYFKWAGEAEAGHAKLYKAALDAKGKLASSDYYVCELCGHTHAGQAPKTCPVCKASSTVFFKVV